MPGWAGDIDGTPQRSGEMGRWRQDVAEDAQEDRSRMTLRFGRWPGEMGRQSLPSASTQRLARRPTASAEATAAIVAS